MDSLIFPKQHSSYDADLPGLNKITKVIRSMYAFN